MSDKTEDPRDEVIRDMSMFLTDIIAAYGNPDKYSPWRINHAAHQLLDKHAAQIKQAEGNDGK